MSRLRFIVLCSLGGLVLISGILLWNARHLAGFKMGALKNMLPANVDMRLSNLFLSETGKSGRTLNIDAQSAHYFKDEDYFLLSEVKALIESDQNSYEVTADKGRYEPENKLIILNGHVKTADQKGRILTGDELELDMEKGTLVSRVHFCLEDPETNLSGKSFVYDTRRGILEVEGRIFMMLNQNI